MKVFWAAFFAMLLLAIMTTGAVIAGWWLASALPRSL
jgi:hypothetical protein